MASLCDAKSLSFCAIAWGKLTARNTVNHMIGVLNRPEKLATINNTIAEGLE
jgi:hypothetical protein